MSCGRHYELWDDYSTCKFFGNLRRVELAFCATCCKLAAAVHRARRRNRALDSDPVFMDDKRKRIKAGEKALKEHYETAAHAVAPHVCEADLWATLKAFAQRAEKTRDVPEESPWQERSDEAMKACLETVRSRVNHRSQMLLTEKMMYRIQREEESEQPDEMLRRIMKSICAKTRLSTMASAATPRHPGWVPVVFDRWADVQPGTLLVYRRYNEGAPLANVEPETSWGLFWVCWVKQVDPTYVGHEPVEVYGHELQSPPHRALRMKGTLHTSKRTDTEQEWIDEQQQAAQDDPEMNQRPCTIQGAGVSCKSWLELLKTHLFFFPIMVDGEVKHYFLQAGDGIVHLPRQHRRQTASAMFRNVGRPFDGAGSSKSVTLRLTLNAEFLLEQVPASARPRDSVSNCARRIRRFFGCV